MDENPGPPIQVRMDTRTPYYGRRIGMPAQPISDESRDNPNAVIEGRYNRGIGSVDTKIKNHWFILGL